MLIKADQVNVQNKVVLTQAQDVFIRQSLVNNDKEEIVSDHAQAAWEKDCPLNDLSLDTLIIALYIGYTIEQTVEEQLLEVWCKMDYSDVGSVYKQGMKSVLDIIGMKVKGINA